MTTPDLKALESMTRDYAAFQARKSGLATALGGFAAVLLFLGPALVDYLGIRVWGHFLLEYLLLVPFAWLIVKETLGRLLYRGLGQVKAIPDPAYERSRWLWIFGTALCLLAFQSLGLLGFALNILSPESARCTFSLWLLVLPLCYLIPAPWLIRGVEEARAYAVLVGLGLMWLTSLFLFSFLAPSEAQRSIPGAPILVPLGLLSFLLALLAWAALAMVRGWKEHREYLAILKNLPKEDA